MGSPIEVFNAGETLHEHGLARHGGLIVPDSTHHELNWQVEDACYGLGNPELAIYEYRHLIKQTVRDNTLTILVAETGVGKTTQTPQILLDTGYSTVYVTQPRRPGARNAYERTTSEINTALGIEDGFGMVSYMTGGINDRAGEENAPIQYITDGIQIAREMTRNGIKEGTVLMVDEVHEQSPNISFLIAWLRKILPSNPQLRVVLSSATMDSDTLKAYYAEALGVEPAVLYIPGRQHNVERIEKPHSTIINEALEIATVEHALLEPDKPAINGTLVFLDGKRTIQDAITEFRNKLPQNIAKQVVTFPLYAKLTKAEQQAAIAHYPGSIKFVFSTDVAQTSLTVPDIKYVLDSGLQRRLYEDRDEAHSLNIVESSQADCSQKGGRVGRVAAGNHIITRLNEATPFVSFRDRQKYSHAGITSDEIARFDLRLREFNMDISSLAMHPPLKERTIEIATMNLKILGALDNDGHITEIGRDMNRYPTSAANARIMVEASRFKEKTRAYVAAIVASNEAGGLQNFGHDILRRWEDLTQESASDMLVQLDLFIASQAMLYGDFKDFDLDINNVGRAHEQYKKIARLSSAYFEHLDPPTEQDREDIMDCMYAGYMTSIYVKNRDDQYTHAFKPYKTAREIGNRSILTVNPPFILGSPRSVEIRRDGETTKKHFIENVSSITIEKLGAIAIDHIKSIIDDYSVRSDGKLHAEGRRVLFGISISPTDEIVTESTPLVLEKIIQMTLDEPGYALRQFLHTKQQLKKLNRIAKDSVPQISDDRVIALVREAAKNGVTNPAMLEDNLQSILLDPKRSLSLNDFVSGERQARIIKNAPGCIDIDGTLIHLRYSKKKPVAKQYKDDEILRLDDEIFLDDGRHVLFSREGERKVYTLQQLKTKILSGS